MNGFRELDAAEMARVEGGSILSAITNFFGGIAGDVGSALFLLWHSFTHPNSPMA
jgi:hypothetical protein